MFNKPHSYTFKKTIDKSPAHSMPGSITVDAKAQKMNGSMRMIDGSMKAKAVKDGSMKAKAGKFVIV